MTLSSRRKTLTSREKKVVKTAVKAVGAQREVKAWLASSAGIPIDWDGLVSQSLITPSQGNADQDRDGDRIRLKSLEMRGEVVVASSTNVLRIIVFKWKPDTSQDVPTPAKILEGFYVGQPLAPFSPYRFDKSHRNKFQVLADRTITVDQTDILKTFIIKKKLSGNVNFNPGGSQGSNQLFVLCISDDGVVSHPSFRWVSEVMYTDP